MIVLRPDNNLDQMDRTMFSVFLAGNLRTEWREEVIEALEDQEDILVLDPTLKDWSEKVGTEDPDNPAFVEQTDWEHMGLIKADLEVFYFDSKSISPITLIELGMYKTKDSIIHLTDDYEKAGYIRYVARRFGIPIVSSVKELSQLIKIRCKTSRLQA